MRTGLFSLKALIFSTALEENTAGAFSLFHL